jgi:hypothetical protein
MKKLSDGFVMLIDFLLKNRPADGKLNEKKNSKTVSTDNNEFKIII